MSNTIVSIGNNGFDPDPALIQLGDTIEWSNTTAVAQVITGPTFTTGPIQPGANSLPIVFDFVDSHIDYASSSGLHGVVGVSA